MSLDQVDRIRQQQQRRVEELIDAGKDNPAALIKALGNLLAETSSDAILNEQAAARRETNLKTQLRELSIAYDALSQERKQIIDMLTREGLYYPESKEEEPLPFWIHGLLCRLDRTDEEI